MDERARKKQRKALRRERVRARHLDAARQRTISTGMGLFVSGGGVTHGRPPPARNDRSGWNFYNDLDEGAVVRKAMAMYPKSPVLRRFFRGATSPKEAGEVGLMLSRAAQAISCDAPRRVPFWIMHGHPCSDEYLSAIVSFDLKKVVTQDGSAWAFPGKTTERGPVYFSTHALDRMRERLCIRAPEQFVNVLGLDYGFTPDGALVMSMTLDSGKFVPIGYCPLVGGEPLIASTFLLPGMKGTPEAGEFSAIFGDGDEIADVRWYDGDRWIAAQLRGVKIPLLAYAFPWLRDDYDEVENYRSMAAASARVIQGDGDGDGDQE
jgi:hypothetical protein